MKTDDTYWLFPPGYTAFSDQRLPKLLRHVARILLFCLLLLAPALIFTPWVQTTTGTGQVTAMDPKKRQQNLHTLVAGRVEEWFVQDGDRVAAGAPIVRIADNDPQLVERLEAELNALRAELVAAQSATATAEIDYQRKTSLRDQGLASQREVEQARIRVQERRATVSSAQAAMARASVAQTQLSRQLVLAPSDGMVVTAIASDSATYVERGTVVASFQPDNAKPAVELFISGRDAPLVFPGRKVRLEINGWPAVQFSGWPAAAIGTFGGLVSFVDATAQPDGTFRVLVIPDPDDQPWPGQTFVRFGAQARGWVLMDEVALGYEIWRVLNQFPPNPPSRGTTR